jgi:phosphoglycolate phosphatase
LSPYFFQVYGGDSFPAKKPDPMGLEALMAEAGARPEETLMIGDSDVDVKTARNAGVCVLGCTFGLATESLLEAEPDALVDAASEWTAALAGSVAVKKF